MQKNVHFDICVTFGQRLRHNILCGLWYGVVTRVRKHQKNVKGKDKMKKILALLLALCMLFALVACGGKADTPENPDSTPGINTDGDNEQLEGEPVKTDYIKDEVIVAEKTTTSLTPWGTNNGTPGNYTVYEMLYECNDSGLYPVLADATYEGSLMAGCDHEAGSGIYKVKIYDYIKDHKGNPVTASDVAYCYNYQFANETTSGWGDFVKATAEDATTVVFEFTKEQSGVGQLLNFLARCFITSEKAHTESASKLAEEMIGTGPYKMESYISGSQLNLVRNADYWQTNEELLAPSQYANVEKLVYKFIDEAAQKVTALQTGEVDIVREMPATDLADFQDGGKYDDQYNVYAYAAKFVYYLVPNCNEASIMNDINMRLAVFNAVDQDGLIQALGGTNTRINGYVSYYSGFYDASWVDYESTPTYNNKKSVDPAVVKSYLEKAGYNNETLTLITAGNSKTTGDIIAAQLNAMGIKCECKALDMASYKSTAADPTAWDLDMGMMAGSEMATVWLHGFGYENMPNGDCTNNFIVDDEWNDLLVKICTEEGHTKENMQKWWDHAAENAYAMGLYNGKTFDIVPADMETYVMGDKQNILPGACVYAEP